MPAATWCLMLRAPTSTNEDPANEDPANEPRSCPSTRPVDKFFLEMREFRNDVGTMN
jgi:hypothetical protein